MPKSGRNIYKRKDGRWEGRYYKDRYTNGKIIYGYIYGKTYAEVRRQLEMLEQDNHLFATVAGQWLSMVSLKVKPSTYACYALSLETHILPDLGTYRIRQLSGTDINSYTRRKLATGRKDRQGGLSVKTVRDLLSIIKSIRDYAYQEQIISSRFAIIYPQLPKDEMRVLTRQEQSALVTVLVKDMDIFKLGILLCLYTGLRVGEICALRWQDVSEDYGVLSVRQTLQRVRSLSRETERDGKKTTILIGAPKSLKSERIIPIPKFMVSFLRRFARKGSNYLLSTAEAAFVEPRTMQNHFVKNIKAAGIDPANYHSLRHTFATRCIEAGADIKSLSEILGHASINITLSRYVHSSLEQKQRCIERLEQYAGI